MLSELMGKRCSDVSIDYDSEIQKSPQKALNKIKSVIDLKSFGFAHVECKEEGCPPYPPSILMRRNLRHLAYIDEQIAEYESLLDSNDNEEDKKENDLYTCPQGCSTHTNGTWHENSDNR